MPSLLSRRTVLASLAAPRRPNLLLLLPDQWRPDWMPGQPAVPLRLPNLEKLIARGVRFSRAITPSPLCAPARACLASGFDYRRCGVVNNGDNYPLAQATYYQLLRDSGYSYPEIGKALRAAHSVREGAATSEI